MRAGQHIAEYRRLKEENPAWRLFNAQQGPAIIGLLQQHLYDEQKTLRASALFERLGRDLDELRAKGEDWPHPPQRYVANWVRDRYLMRRLSADGVEEEYELSLPMVELIRFLSGLARPRRKTATESRLGAVTGLLSELAEQTDADVGRRLGRLQEEQRRLEKEIVAAKQGKVQTLPEGKALEKARDIIAMAGDLTDDFIHVRDDFAGLNQQLRDSIVKGAGEARGDVLESLFAGYDHIGNSPAGRTFAGFWRLLIDHEQSAMLDSSIDDVLSRGFATSLEREEREFLQDLRWRLLKQGGVVHKAGQEFARTLNRFVQTREYLEARRINSLLQDAERALLECKDDIKGNRLVGFELELTSCSLRSLSQLRLFDPELQAPPEPMHVGEAAQPDMKLVGDLVADSDIDFRTLKMQVLAVLEASGQATIGDILSQYPPRQGLGSVIGLLCLAFRAAEKFRPQAQSDGEPFEAADEAAPEMVEWTGKDGQARSARIPKFYFVLEKANEL